MMLNQFINWALASPKAKVLSIFMIIFLILFIFYQFLTTISHLHAESRLSDSLSKVVTVANPDQGTEWLNKLSQENLFGKALEELPITSLQLRLTGILQDGKGNSSQVIIAESTEPGKVYQLGEEVVAGIRIQSITPSGVILERQGNLENLPLVRNALIFKDVRKSI